MKRGTLTLMMAGVALALAIPTVSALSGPVSGEQGFQLALDDGQPAPGPGPGGGEHPDKLHHGWGHEGGWGPQQLFKHRCETGEASEAALLAYAEVRLQLTDAQKPAWAKFVDAAKAARAPEARLCADLADKPVPATLPERLARIEQVASARLAQLQAFRPALDELYQQLTPEQRKTADLLARHGIGHHHGG